MPAEFLGRYHFELAEELLRHGGVRQLRDPEEAEEEDFRPFWLPTAGS